jgi:sedoheptulokinase
MFWNQARAWERVEKDNNLVRYDVVQGEVSALYTWQDSRCDPAFLATLPVPRSHLRVYTGFGVATIFWMAKNK